LGGHPAQGFGGASGQRDELPDIHCGVVPFGRDDDLAVGVDDRLSVVVEDIVFSTVRRMRPGRVACPPR
jgi:hypothetical protein